MSGREHCAGAIVHDPARRLLLIRRGTPPAAGGWSVPGGRCRAGEPAAEACAREVAEETSLQVEVVSLAGRVERPAPGGGVFVIDDFRCRVVGGALRAGDDAADAGWFTRAELETLDLVPGLIEALTEWDVLPA